VIRLNHLTVAGNLCADPELRSGVAGKEVASARLAVADGYGEKEKTHFFDVKIFGTHATSICAHARKGSCIVFEGRLTMESWESKEGEKKSRVVIVAHRWQFGAPPRDGAKVAKSEEGDF